MWATSVLKGRDCERAHNLLSRSRSQLCKQVGGECLGTGDRGSSSQQPCDRGQVPGALPACFLGYKTMMMVIALFWKACCGHRQESILVPGRCSINVGFSSPRTEALSQYQWLLWFALMSPVPTSAPCVLTGWLSISIRVRDLDVGSPGASFQLRVIPTEHL